MQDWIFIVIIIVFALAVFLVMGIMLYRKNHPRQVKRRQRTDGTAPAVNAARNFARTNNFRFIAPAHLAGGGAFANLDAIVVGYFGVLGVIALGYNGEIYGVPNEDEWLQVNEGDIRTHFKNPMVEASADVRVIRDALFAAKLKQIPVEVVYVFTDITAQIALPKSAGHYTTKSFKNQLKKEKYLEDTGLDLDKVEAAIRAAIVE